MVKKLTKKMIDVLREMVEFTCQNCKKHENEVGKLQAHRIHRGYMGGKYVPNNILMLCEKCHKEFHGGEIYG